MRHHTPPGPKLWGLVLVILIAASCSKSGPTSPPPQTTPFLPSPTPAPAPAPSNHNPVITAFNVTDFGVSGLTTISMSASATDEDNDAVSYRWTIGGTGQTANGPSFSTILTGDGAIDVALTVTDSKGGSTTNHRNVVIGTMTGQWRYVPTSGNACGTFGLANPPILTLTQVGGVVTGDLSSPSAWCNVPAGQNGRLDPGAPGSIDEQGNFKARLKIGSFLDGFFTAKMDATGRELTGTVTFQNSSGFGTFWLRKI
ncbi:MAG TPA: PKD domain-containing protein [Vicinamibacterales bacterium]